MAVYLFTAIQKNNIHFKLQIHFNTMFLTSYSSNLRPNKLENKINNTQLSNITNKKLILIKKK